MLCFLQYIFVLRYQILEILLWDRTNIVSIESCLRKEDNSKLATRHNRPIQLYRLLVRDNLKNRDTVLKMNRRKTWDFVEKTHFK